MTLLMAAQTLFYFTVSFAIIVLSILTGMIAYQLVKITKELRRITDNLGDASDDLKESLADALEQLQNVPFLSMFMNGRHTGARHKKGRSK